MLLLEKSGKFDFDAILTWEGANESHQSLPNRDNPVKFYTSFRKVFAKVS